MQNDKEAQLFNKIRQKFNIRLYCKKNEKHGLNIYNGRKNIRQKVDKQKVVFRT